VSQDCNSATVDLVFVVDSSGSIEEAGAGNWNLVLNFVNQVINQLNIGETQTRVAVTRFANIGESMFNLNTDYNKQSIQNRVIGISYVDGNTNTSGGIRDMHFNQFTEPNGDRLGVPNVAIIITDGVSTYDKARTIPDAIDARNNGIKIISVGITNAIDENELRQMSSMPQEEGRNYFRSADFNQLDTIVDAIVAETCTVVSSEFLYCKDTGENGNQCFCTYDTCDIRPTNSTQCTDIDECETDNGGCEQNCLNQQGDYFCSCNNGYVLRDDRRTCGDVNECQNSNPCFNGQQCVNTYGSYYCIATGGAQGLSAVDPAAAGAASTTGVVTQSTVVLSSVLSAVVAVLVAVAVVLTIRYGRRRCASGKSQKSTSSSSRLHISPSSHASNVDTFGFSTVSSKFSGRPGLDMDDCTTIDSTSSTVDMNY